MLTSVKKVPKSSRKRQNSQSAGSGGRKGNRIYEGLRDDPLDMLQTSWFDEKVNGDDDMRRASDKRSADKPKSRKKSDYKGEKAAGNGKASRRSRSDSENMLQFGFTLDEMRDIRPNGGVAGRSEQSSDMKRRRDARSSFEQAWNQNLFATRPDFRMDALLSPGSAFGAQFELEQSSSGDVRKSAAATLDKQILDEKTGRTRCRRRSDVKGDAVKMSLEMNKPEALMANMAVDAGSSSMAANLPNHKVSFFCITNSIALNFIKVICFSLPKCCTSWLSAISSYPIQVPSKPYLNTAAFTGITLLPATVISWNRSADLCGFINCIKIIMSRRSTRKEPPLPGVHNFCCTPALSPPVIAAETND